MKIRQAAVCVAFVLTCIGTALAATPVSFDATFSRNGSPIAVSFRAWMPDGVDRLRGVVINLPGSNGDTRNVTTNGTWQARLPGMGFGIVGLKDLLGNVDQTYWGATPAEVESNLQVLMDSLATRYGHAELSNGPVLLDGLSKGAYASSYIAGLAPNRVIGYVGDKGFLLPDGGSPGLSVAPGMVIAGSLDTTVAPYLLCLPFNQTRQYDSAKVALTMDWGVAHAATNPAIRFADIDQLIRARYPHGQLPSLTPHTPLALIDNIADPWLAQSNLLDLSSGTLDSNTKFIPINWPRIGPASSYVPDPLDDFGMGTPSWLPSKAAAMIYRAQNDATFSSQNRPLQVTIANGTNGNIDGGAAIDIRVTLSSLASTHIELYHEDQLLAVFTQGSGTREFFYTPTENGLHTFIAIAQYDANGQTLFTSNFATAGASGVAVPEPCSMAAVLGIAAMMLFALHRDNRSRRHCGLVQRCSSKPHPAADPLDSAQVYFTTASAAIQNGPWHSFRRFKSATIIM